MVEILLFLVCLICIRLKRSYCELAEEQTTHERKPGSLYITLKHTSFLNSLSDTVTLAAFAFFSLYVAFGYETAWAFVIILGGLSLIFVLLPMLRAFGIEKKLAGAIASVPAYFLKRLEKPIDKFEKFSTRLGHRANPPKPIGKQELKELFKNQGAMADEDMKTDLNLALTGLELNRQKAGYLMIRRQKTRTVKLDDEVGPVLLSELHETGRKVFPAEDASEIAGIVRLDKLAELKAGGKTSEALDPQMIVVNKDEPVLNVIRRFVESGAELVFAEDSDGKVAGIIYLEDVLRELIED